MVLARFLSTGLNPLKFESTKLEIVSDTRVSLQVLHDCKEDHELSEREFLAFIHKIRAKVNLQSEQLK